MEEKRKMGTITFPQPRYMDPLQQAFEAVLGPLSFVAAVVLAIPLVILLIAVWTLIRVGIWPRREKEDLL